MTKSKREFAVLALEWTDLCDGKFVRKVEHLDVRVMARAEGYAMVRKKGAVPFVCSEKQLTPNA